MISDRFRVTIVGGTQVQGMTNLGFAVAAAVQHARKGYAVFLHDRSGNSAELVRTTDDDGKEHYDLTPDRPWSGTVLNFCNELTGRKAHQL